MTAKSFENYRDIYVSVNGITLTGIVQTPEQAKGIVTFAHGVSSSRFSPINRYVSKLLTDAGFATLLIDLLTPGERVPSKQRDLQANILLLASRLICTIEWVKHDEALQHLPLGVFGTNISAAATLAAAIERADDINAIVLSNARPDLINDYLPRIQAPTLLIAGDKDRAQLQSNREAVQTLGGKLYIKVISGSTHDSHNQLILEQIATYTREWFTQIFTSNRQTE